jgi:cytochrome c biogenesis protein CcmG/thiol:disulfide interchange protein DsbE
MRRFVPLVFALLGAAFVWQLQRDTPVTPGSKEAAAPFALPDLAGRRVALEDLRGKAVLLNFWATWCPPCRAELPELQATWLAHQDCLDVVGITEDSGSAAEVAEFAREHGVGYRLLIDDGSAGRAFHVDTIPRSVLLDAQGRVIGTFNGAVTRKTIERALTPAC